MASVCLDTYVYEGICCILVFRMSFGWSWKSCLVSVIYIVARPPYYTSTSQTQWQNPRKPSVIGYPETDMISPNSQGIEIHGINNLHRNAHRHRDAECHDPVACNAREHILNKCNSILMDASIIAIKALLISLCYVRVIY